MSKIDPTRNYYAELEVPADADEADIRKQFRKLALKYHPDRNPGREQEVVPKFQAIQAASEVLLDPQQRVRYDADRRKQGFRYNTASYAGNRPAPPPRTNMYTKAPSDFPPPPRRAGPNAARPRSEFTSPRGSKFGPESFANFPRPPTAQRPSATDDAERRANNFSNYSAWQKLHPHPPGKPQPARGAEDTFKPFGHASNAKVPRPTYNSNTAKPAMERSNTTKTPRKSGFDPAMPGADEKQAAGTSGYYTHVKPPRPPPRMQTDAPPQAPSDPLNQFSSPGDDAPFAEGRPRLRTPYQSSTGERTFFNSAGLGRSASTRNSPSRPNTSEQQFFPGSTASPGLSRPHRSASPRARKPVPESFHQRPSPNKPEHNRTQAGNATRPFLNQYDSSDEESAEEGAAPQNRTNGDAGHNGVNGNQASDGRQPGSIFNIPFTEDKFATKPANFKSRSTDSINTKFSPEEWAGKFQGAPDYFTPPKSADRARASPTRGRASSRPSPAPQMGSMPPPPPPPPPPMPHNSNPQGSTANPNTQASRPPPVKFSPSQWSQTFKDPSWAYPQPEASPTKTPAQNPINTAPQRPKKPPVQRPTKTPKSRKDSTKAPKAATVNDIAEEPELASTSTESFGSGDGSAMDIDEDLSPMNGHGATSGSRSPRRVTVTPDKPEWREGSNLSVPHPPNSSGSTPDVGDRRASFRMGSFAHVAPFGPSQDGLSNVADMSSHLPFKSAPANEHPQKVFAVNNEIMVPKPPKPPKEPQRISKASWTDYIKQLSSYMTLWDGYNAAMTKHFVDRQSEVDTICRAFADPHNNSNMSGLRDAGRFAWLGAVGDTAQGGFGSYLQGLKDDEQVREHWTVACDRHRDCIQRCSGLRDRVLREAEAGRLPEV